MKLFLLIFFTFTVIVYSQDEFTKWKEQYVGELKKWKTVRDEDFKKFVEKKDKEFATYLKKNWTLVKTEFPIILEKPKPDTIPTFIQPNIETKPKKIKTKLLTEIKSAFQEQKKDCEPLLPRDEIVKPVYDSIRIIFFDTPIYVNLDKNFLISSLAKINNLGLSEFFLKMSKTEYLLLLQELTQIKTKYKFNDWAYALFVKRVAAVLTSDENTTRALVWFLMIKSGYDVKIGYKKDKVFTLIYTENVVFNTTYYSFKGKRYYILDFENKKQASLESIYVYDMNYSYSIKPFDFIIYETPLFKLNSKNRDINFRYNKVDYKLPSFYNENLIQFLKYYPQVNLEVYLRSTVSNELLIAPIEKLRELIKDKSEYEKVNLILKFVQLGFNYKTDQQQFNREKWFFPEEVISYKFSDCEDRSILFTHLVKELVGLNVICLEYPSHVATAVYFTENIKGDYILFNNKKYVICDPTYFGSDVGHSMKKYVNQEANVKVP